MRNRILLALAVLSFQLSAAPVATVNTITAAWQAAVASPAGGTIAINNGGDPITARWGTPVGSAQSGYNFDKTNIPSAISAFDNVWFQIGTFTHLNFPITGTSLDTIQLKLTLGFTPTGGSADSKNFVYNIDHDETPNGQVPCPYQPNNSSGCSDKVTLVGQPAQTIFTIGTTQYTLALAFGSLNGTVLTTSNELITQEGVATSASIYGKFTTDVVPEPGFYGVLAIGFSGLMFAARRRAKA